MSRYEAGEDPYLYPGTNVLKNRFNITDPAGAERAEVVASIDRMKKGVPPLRLTADGFLALHKHVFQDVWEWAGQPRTVPLSKGNSRFAQPEFIRPELDKLMTRIAADDALQDADRLRFSQTVAEPMGDLNAIHPFREGNGRILRMFLGLLAERAGLKFDQSSVEAKTWMKASINSFNGDCRLLTQIIISATERA